MKQYTDQGKVDTRSGIGARAFCGICCMFCMLSCAPKELFKGEPEEGSMLFIFSFECLVNGEKVSRTQYFEYSRYDYKYGLLHGEPYLFAGYIWEEDSNRKNVYNFKGVDYDNLAFCMTLTPEGQAPPPLYNGNRCIHPFYFYIPGDGDGPFMEGVDYASPNNVVFYFPENPGQIDLPGRPGHYELPDFHGLEVKLLSSSFKFGYSESDVEYVPALLDFYFDFEEVITSVPDRYHCTPVVGDTIRVANGHFVQSLFMHDLNIDYKFVTPK